MTLHDLMVLTTGLLFLASAAVVGVIFRTLGPTFHTRVNAHWGWRTLAFVAGLVLLIRAVTILFPGDLVRVQLMTPIATAEAVIALAVSLAILDWVMRDRSPPPWTVNVTRLIAVLGWDAVKTMGMRVPVARIGDPPPPDDPPGRLMRAAVQIAGFCIIAAVIALIVANRGA